MLVIRCGHPGEPATDPKPAMVHNALVVAEAASADVPPGRVLGVTPRNGAQKRLITIRIGARDGVVASWQGTLFNGGSRIGSFTIVKGQRGCRDGHVR